MKTYKYILFDLDGTVTDSGIGIVNSVIYALNKFDITETDLSKVKRFIGPPLWESFEKYYGFSKEQSLKAVEYYREYYNTKGIFENHVYDGIEQLLKLLNEKGKTVILATSKPEYYAKKILDHFKLTKYFSYIAGSNLDGTRVKKDEVIHYALTNFKIQDLSQVVMIGDREHDIVGARKCGIESIGVLFGYGSKKELEHAGAGYIAKSVITLQDILFN